jgi:hypothetical protein
VTEILWGHIERARAQGGLDLLFTGPPVLPTGRACAEALEVDGLQEAIDIQEAFTKQGWTLNRGHDFALNTNFTIGESAAMVSMGFDRVNDVYTWAATCVYLNPRPFSPLLKSEYEFLSVLMHAAENQFPSSIITFSRGMTFQGVPDEWLPKPFVWVVPEENAVVWNPDQRRLVTHPLAQAYRMVLLGYRWQRAPDQDVRTALITQSVNQLVVTLEVLTNLQQQDPHRFVEELGDAIPLLGIDLHHEALGSIDRTEAAMQTPSSQKLSKSHLDSLTKQAASTFGGSSIFSSQLPKGLGQGGGLPSAAGSSLTEPQESGISVAQFQLEMGAMGSREEDGATIEDALSTCGVVLMDVLPPTQTAQTWIGAKGNCLVATTLGLEHHHLTVMVMAVMDVPNTEEFLSWILLRPTPPVCRFAVEPERRNGRDVLDVHCVGMLQRKIDLEGVSDLIDIIYETATQAAEVIVDRFGGAYRVGADERS